MALENPDWRVKTRPCPFYPLGRCIFTDSCNFLHSDDLVHSPPRSPRTNNLLLALADVIGYPEGTQASEENTDSWNESLPTLVNEAGSGLFSFPSVIIAEHPLVNILHEQESQTHAEEGNWTAISNYDDEKASHPLPDLITQDETVGGDSDSSETNDIEEEATLTILDSDQRVVDIVDDPSSLATAAVRSPMSLSTSMGLLSSFNTFPLILPPLSPVFFNHSAKETTFHDSGYVDYKPLALMSSPTGSSRTSSLADLLSSPFKRHSTRILSPRLSAFFSRSPPRPGSPALTTPVNEHSLADDLDSPRDYFAARLRDMTLADNEEQEEEIVGQDSLVQASMWDSEPGDTAVLIGQTREQISDEVDGVMKRMATTPTHFLRANLDVTRSEYLPEDDVLLNVSSISNNHEERRIPTMNENDTLNNLYEIYSGTAPAETSTDPGCPGLAQQQPSPLSNSSTSTDFLRQRVSTPPPTTTTKSPGSLVTQTSPDSVSVERQTPFSLSGGPPTRNHSPGLQDIDVFEDSSLRSSTSFSLRRGMSVMGNRRSRGSVKLSPLKISDNMSMNTPQLSPPVSSSSSLRPLILSTIFDARSKSPSVPLSASSASFMSRNFFSSRNISQKSLSSASVSSSNSISDNRLLSSARSSNFPLPIRKSSQPSTLCLSPLSPPFFNNLANFAVSPRSAPVLSRQSINYSRPSSRLSDRFYKRDAENDDVDDENYTPDPYGETIRRRIPPVPYTAPATTVPVLKPMYTVKTPKPNLMFAIASDNLDQVKHVLQNGEVGPNDSVGPRSALEFTLTNDKLLNKPSIVKALLAYGADPSGIKNLKVSAQDNGNANEFDDPPSQSLIEIIDPATRYYIERSDSVQTQRISVLINRSVYSPLTRIHYELVGQDRVLEQLFRVLSIQSRNLSTSPIVLLLCGPSGHGKSLLAQKFGSIMNIATHTVNMTSLRSTHDLWQSHSISTYENLINCTLAEFLLYNEGKRCVVVLDEIEKIEDQKVLWSLLMPWELGRCSFEAGSRHVNVKNVIWLATSNLGHELVFQHQDSRKCPNDSTTREEYLDLMALLRPKVSEKLGSSVLSRITSVLPFVPFTLDEKRAICYEALYTAGGLLAQSLSPTSKKAIIDAALANYSSEEGVRSLSRAITNHLVDVI